MSIFKRDCDCADCVLGWEELDYEGDCNDCGCMYYSNPCGNGFVCGLPTCIKSVIHRIKKREKDKAEMKMFDDLVERHEEQERKTQAMLQAINENVFKDCYGEKLVLCSRDSNGELWLYNYGKALDIQAYDVVKRYEELLEKKEEE